MFERRLLLSYRVLLAFLSLSATGARSLSANDAPAFYDRAIALCESNVKTVEGFPSGGKATRSSLLLILNDIRSFATSARLASQSAVSRAILEDIEAPIKMLLHGTSENLDQIPVLSALRSMKRNFELAKKLDFTTDEEMLLAKLANGDHSGLVEKMLKLKEGEIGKLNQGIAELMEKSKQNHLRIENEKNAWQAELSQARQRLQERTNEANEEIKRLQELKGAALKIGQLESDINAAEATLNAQTAAIGESVKEMERLAGEKRRLENDFATLKNAVEAILAANTTGIYHSTQHIDGLSKIYLPTPEETGDMRTSVSRHITALLANWLETIVADRRSAWERTPLRIDVNAQIVNFDVTTQRGWGAKAWSKIWSGPAYVLTVSVVGSATDPLHKKTRTALLTFDVKGGKIEPDASSSTMLMNFFESLKEAAEGVHADALVGSNTQKVAELVRQGLTVQEIQNRISRFAEPRLNMRVPASVGEAARLDCENKLLTDAEQEEIELDRLAAAQAPPRAKGR